MKTRLSALARRRDRLDQLRLLSRFEKSLAKKLTSLIVAQGKTLASAYKSHKHISVQDLVSHKAQFVTLMNNYYKRVMLAFAERVGRSIKSSVFDDAMADWIAKNSLTSVNDVDATTLSIVKTVIQDGIDNGLSTEDIVVNIIERTGSALVNPRATAIARTELHQAANVASVIAAKATKLTLNKVWTSTGDSRTREAHALADGQSVPIDDFFTVDGEQVSQPGDGSPENAINCRCCVVFEEVSASST